MKPVLKSFLLGFASLFDVLGVLTAPRPRATPPAQADLEALRSDWAAVWGDLRHAFAQATDGQGQAQKPLRLG